MRTEEAHNLFSVESMPPVLWLFGSCSGLPAAHVVSRDKNGKVASYANDFVWDWSAYESRNRRQFLYFYYWTDSRPELDRLHVTPEREARIRELQYLMARLIYREDGVILSGATLQGHLGGLRLFARFAEVQSCSIRELLESQSMLDRFIGWVPDSAAEKILFWLRFLSTRDLRSVGYVVAESKLMRSLEVRAQHIWDSLRQNAPVPSRIYASIINSLSSELDDIEVYQERLLSALVMSVSRPSYLVTSWNKSLGPEIISKYGLEEFFERRGFSKSLMGLRAIVGEIYRICKLQIHVFSGMRDAEAQYLPFHCLDTVNEAHGRSHCFIVGVTTKLSAGHQKRARWVTTERDGFRAVRIAQQFASVVYSAIGITPGESESARDLYPLFISVEYLSGRKFDLPSTPGAFTVSTTSLSTGSSSLHRRLRPVIEESDLAELEEIDAFRAWRDEPEYSAGQLWPLRPHQLRRSLAMYANASGLVRLSSLRRQLQHITREMTLYYARGSAFVINFVSEDLGGFKRHIASEWQSGEQEAQYMSFVRDVLHSDEPMHGTAGTYYERQKSRGEVLLSEEFNKQIKMGRLAYRSSPLGGCTNPGSCEAVKGPRLMQATCLTENCKFLIGKHSKIIRLIEIQRSALRHLDPNSIAYDMEIEDLNVLVATELEWRSGKSAIAKCGAENV